MAEKVQLPSDQQQTWEDLANFDAYWAILSDPSKKGGGWDPEEFFAQGESEVSEDLARAAEITDVPPSGKALDFGCGYGRLTRALAGKLGAGVGVDVSTEMIAGAQKLNAEIPELEFRVNDAADLAQFEDATFDIVYSKIVLQHVPDRAVIANYIREFVRVAKPGGVLIFQLPSSIPFKYRAQPVAHAYNLLRKLGVSPKTLFEKFKLQPMRMESMSVEAVTGVLNAAGVAAVTPDTERLESGSYSTTYFVSR